MSKQNCNVEVFSRVTGFFRPVQSWNKGKVAEFGDRERFNVDKKQIENKDGNCRVAEPLAG